MEYISLIGSVTLIHLLAVMSPGPDFLVVMKHSLTQNRTVAIWTSLGIGAGISIHVLYSFVGLALIIQNSVILFNIVKYAGVVYLAYLGLSSIMSKSSSLSEVSQGTAQSFYSKWKSFQVGFLTNVLNPKATLFFLSLFTLVIDQDTPNPVMVLISIIMIINTALWFVLLSYMITIPGIRDRFNAYERVFNLVFGILLILVAVQIAFS